MTLRIIQGTSDVTLSTYFIRKLSKNSFLFVSWCTDHTYYDISAKKSFVLIAKNYFCAI